jgi:hypothetical protein
MKRILLALLAVILISVGIYGSGDRAVWGKAALICLECIGIG